MTNQTTQVPAKTITQYMCLHTVPFLLYFTPYSTEHSRSLASDAQRFWQESFFFLFFFFSSLPVGFIIVFRYSVDADKGRRHLDHLRSQLTKNSLKGYVCVLSCIETTLYSTFFTQPRASIRSTGAVTSCHSLLSSATMLDTRRPQCLCCQLRHFSF